MSTAELEKAEVHIRNCRLQMLLIMAVVFIASVLTSVTICTIAAPSLNYTSVGGTGNSIVKPIETKTSTNLDVQVIR